MTQDPADSVATPDSTRFAIVAKSECVVLEGELGIADAAEIWDGLTRATKGAHGRIDFDLRKANRVDGSVMALLVALRRKLGQRGVECEFVGGDAALVELVRLYKGDQDTTPLRVRRPEGSIQHIGRATVAILKEVRLVVEFVGATTVSFLGVLRRPRTGNWADIAPIIERAGADAVPIVILINFLVGFVMGYQAADQLKQYGANLFVADLVGISVTRELGPLMTAIILCGRSGAAITAELGSMKVAEEIDALRTIGLGPMRYLVLPRAIALIVVAPLLTALADIVGIAGGLVVAITSLDVSATAYITQTQKAVHLFDLLTGLVKATVFGAAIAIIACQQGFATSGGAEGVGQRTTSTVVTCLFAIVLLDALFTVIFRILGV